MRSLDIRPAFQVDIERIKRARTVIDWDTLHYIFAEVIEGRSVPAGLKPHALLREWSGWSEFHLENDLLVIYRLTAEWAVFYRIGRHRQLFSRVLPRSMR